MFILHAFAFYYIITLKKSGITYAIPLFFKYLLLYLSWFFSV
ncbi:hypothetical protein BACSTE_00326 [Bacteroides stercoris ATCC 43183]|uniref:Uncharacterized protein n=1 Tax=Bacteroides stercoris ATCC 43183 TaxID=449673 RepID=B0NLG0_BACSE|nr:hypothetical protein BACSTE_00326 [Bacteroides stercoris ATCC 43183]